MKHQGFTLIEVLIVIAIIAILSALALPSYLRWLAQAETQSAAVFLAQQLQNARTQAKRGTAQRVSTTAGSSLVTLTPVQRVGGAWTATGTGARTSTLEGATAQTTSALVFLPPYGNVEIDAVPQAIAVQSTRRTSVTRSVRVISLMGKVVVQ